MPESVEACCDCCQHKTTIYRVHDPGEDNELWLCTPCIKWLAEICQTLELRAEGE